MPQLSGTILLVGSRTQIITTRHKNFFTSGQRALAD